LFYNFFRTTTESLHRNEIDFCGSLRIYVDNLALRVYLFVQACFKGKHIQTNLRKGVKTATVVGLDLKLNIFALAPCTSTSIYGKINKNTRLHGSTFQLRWQWLKSVVEFCDHLRQLQLTDA